MVDENGNYVVNMENLNEFEEKEYVVHDGKVPLEECSTEDDVEVAEENPTPRQKPWWRCVIS